MRQNKAQGLPVNIVVTLIIGIIIFGLGFAMFARISSSGDEQIEELNSKIRTDLQAIECDGEEWVCSPNNKMKNGDVGIFSIFITNHDNENDEFTIKFKDDTDSENEFSLSSDSCGEIEIMYPKLTFNVQSGSGASVPFRVSANGVKKTPCSFVTTATLLKGTSLVEQAKTSVIIRID